MNNEAQILLILRSVNITLILLLLNLPIMRWKRRQCRRMDERVCCYNSINRRIKTIHQQKYKQDPKIKLANTMAHEYQQIFKSHTSKVSWWFLISLRHKWWSNWPGINFILIRVYNPHNILQVWEYQFQDLRTAFTNKELIKIRYSSWKSSGIQLWSL
jgi:hypothetical protein